MLELVGLGQAGGAATRYQMSGGQQQRVALARALAIEPQRAPARRAALGARREGPPPAARGDPADPDRVGTTTLFVTHDQEEALALGDRVGVMSAGRLEQIAPPAELYDRPADGVRGRVRRPDQPAARHGRRRRGRASSATRVPLLDGSAGPGAVTALVRPEAVKLALDDDGPAPRARGELPRIARPRPGRSCRTARSWSRRVRGRRTWSGSRPGTAVRVSVVPAPVFAVAVGDGRAGRRRARWHRSSLSGSARRRARSTSSTRPTCSSSAAGRAACRRGAGRRARRRPDDAARAVRLLRRQHHAGRRRGLRVVPARADGRQRGHRHASSRSAPGPWARRSPEPQSMSQRARRRAVQVRRRRAGGGGGRAARCCTACSSRRSSRTARSAASSPRASRDARRSSRRAWSMRPAMPTSRRAPARRPARRRVRR